jgi:Tfp pilus assembly protein PilN
MPTGTKLRLELPSRKTPEVPINLLPQELVGEQRTKRYFGYATSVAIGLVVLLILVSVLQHIKISSEQNTLEQVQAQVTTLQGQVGALAPYAQLKATVDAKRHTLATALVGDVSWTRFLDDLTHRMPGDSSLTTLSLSATTGTTPDGQVSYGTVQYNGVVKDFPGLAGWLDTMGAARGLHFVYLGSGTKASQQNGANTVTFTASAFLTSSALSGRCQTETAPCP